MLRSPKLAKDHPSLLLPYTRDFIMEGAPLPSNEGVRPWSDRHGGKVADYVGKALLLPIVMGNWKKMDGEGMLLALKRNVVLVRILLTMITTYRVIKAWWRWTGGCLWPLKERGFS